MMGAEAFTAHPGLSQTAFPSEGLAGLCVAVWVIDWVGALLKLPRGVFLVLLGAHGLRSLDRQQTSSGLRRIGGLVRSRGKQALESSPSAAVF